MKHSIREHWQSRLGIIFATSGSAIGLGTIWKLPYLVGQNGGGAFIAIFIIFTLFLGIPLFIAELALGKTFQKGVIKTFQLIPSKSGFMPIFGWLAIISTFLIAGWYGVVSGWGLNYFVMALTDGFKDQSPQSLSHIFERFRSSAGLNVLWQSLFILATCAILAKGVRDGIERFSKIFFSLLFILVFGLFIFSTTLSGFNQAFDYIIKPDFLKLTKESILSALGLSLFALSLGQGIMVTYGSYLSKEQSIFKTSLIVSSSVIIISILISLMIFPMVFTFGFEPAAGESLLFVIMPFVTERLPGSMVISALFFLLLIFAALTSYIGQLEVLIASFMDSFIISRTKACFFVGLGCFFVGLPTSLMVSEYNPFPDFEAVFHKNWLKINDIVIDWMLIVFSLAVCLAIFRLNKSDLMGILNCKKNEVMFFIWYTLIRFLVPSAIIFVALARAGLIAI